MEFVPPALRTLPFDTNYEERTNCNVCQQQHLEKYESLNRDHERSGLVPSCMLGQVIFTNMQMPASRATYTVTAAPNVRVRAVHGIQELQRHREVIIECFYT